MSDYNFSFILETPLQKGGTIQIIFPSQFYPGMGLNTIIIPSGTCNYPCKVFSRTVEFTLT